MAIPLIYVAALGIRVAAPTILRYITKHGAKKAANKYGQSVVTQANKLKNTYKGKDKSMLSAIKNALTFSKTKTKFVHPRLKPKKLQAKKKVEFKPTSPKQKNIKAKTDKKYNIKTF